MTKWITDTVKVAMIGKREDAIGHRDIGEGDDRDPDDVQKRDDHADAVGAEPVEPADAVFALLLTGQAIDPRQQPPPMLAQQLEAAIGPALALALIGVEGVGQEPMTVAMVGVVGDIAVLEKRKAEIGVLDDGVGRPIAGGRQRRAPNQAHGAMHDDGVDLVTLHHADVEEAGIFGVHGAVHDGAVAVAVVLRRLHEAHPGVGE